MVSHLCFSFGVYIIGVSLVMLLKYFVIKGLGGFRVLVIIGKKLGLVWGCFWSLALAWSSSSQSDDIADSSGQILHRGVHITQYFECSVIFAGAAGEVGEGVDGVSISWLPCMGARLVDVICATSLASWDKPLPVVDAQFSWVASGSFLTLILLGWIAYFYLVWYVVQSLISSLLFWA